MIWIAMAVFGFLIVAGARLWRAGTPPEDRERAKPAVALGDGDESAALVLAARWRRIAGRVVDGVVVIGLAVAVSIVATIALGASTTPAGLHRLRLATAIGAFAVYGVYETAMVASSGQTLGKMATRTRVVSVATGEDPSSGEAFARWLLPAVTSWVVPLAASPAYLNGTGGFSGSGFVLAGEIATLLVYGVALVDPARRGLHDRFAQTVVVDAGRSR